VNRPSLRSMTVLAALAVATLAAACAHAPVEALPPLAPNPASSSPAQPIAITTPSTATPASSRPSQPTTRPHTCLGAVYYTFDTTTAMPRWPTLCISLGGVLRLANQGPEGVSISPADKVSCFYEAGVRECRLIRTGTVRFTIVKPSGTRILTLIVAGSSPRPAPACVPAGETHVVDVLDGGPPWNAICLKLGAVLRFENHGPDDFSVEPSGVVSCFYEAGVRECRFVKAGTVTFTILLTQETRTLTVVAIR